jgi:endonuclease III
MKDSKKYAEKLQKTIRALKRKYGKVNKPKYGLGAQSLVYAVLSQYLSESASAAAMKKITSHFVDFNELRVSRTDELTDVIGKDTADTREMSELMPRTLMAIFDKYDVVNLEALEEAGKKQAKATLEKLLPESRYITNYVTLTVFEGHAIPLTGQMLDYLKANELIHPESTQEDIEGFLERQVPASSAYEFYALLRKEAETTMPKKPSATNNSTADQNNKAAVKEVKK